ncbi:MAG: toll/interleukin-1 receptor domain-containing protein [Bacteroidota bacterium]
MNIFLSHISEESSEARAIKIALENALPGLEVFVSAVDIHFGQQWMAEINDAMNQAQVILVLCSPQSVRRPWINFESGSGWARHMPVIPMCHKGLLKGQLPDPLGIFQGVELINPDSCQKLVNRLSDELNIHVSDAFDAGQMFSSLKPEPVQRTQEIGIVLTHKQNEWETDLFTIFDLWKRKPDEVSGEWILKPLLNKNSFLSEDLNKFSGLIFATPWWSKLEPEIILATVEWVKKGGRLLLLGFELGDRHHSANLAELSIHFGISPAIDIVGPPGFGQGKPYSVTIEFDPLCADNHLFTGQLKTIRLQNVQTLRVEPGGIEWLRTGKNLVYHPKKENVVYRQGVMTAPGGNAFSINENAGWLPVAVEAPRGLCGQGGVHMIGSWDLLGRYASFGGDNNILVARLLDWLGGYT